MGWGAYYNNSDILPNQNKPLSHIYTISKTTKKYKKSAITQIPLHQILPDCALPTFW